MTKKTENRTATLGVEVRAADGTRTLSGYAIVFNSPTDIGGYFTEQVAPGACSDAVSGDVRALFDHKSAYVLGRTKAGTLRLSEDARGLKFEVDLPDTQIGRDVATSVERGDITGMSFNFRAIKEMWDDTVDPPLRTLMKIEIDEISVVAFPAYEDTEVGVRSLQEHRDAKAAAAAAEQDTVEETETKPAATSANRTAALLKQKLSMRLDLKVRTGA